MPVPSYHDVGGSAVSLTTGNYCTLSFGPITDTTIGVQTDTIASGIIMPFAFRLLKIAWGVSVDGAALATVQVQRHASAFSTTGMDDIMSADLNVDASTSGTILVSGTTPTISVRDLNRGDRVFVTLTTDGTGTVSALQVFVVGYITGFVNLDPADD